MRPKPLFRKSSAKFYKTYETQLPERTRHSRVPLDVVCFSTSLSESVADSISELNTVWTSVEFGLRNGFNRPILPAIRPGQWLTKEDFKPILFNSKRPGIPLIAVTEQRFGQDYFYYRFPEDETAVFTTFMSDWVPAYILLPRFLQYSFVYSALELLCKLSIGKNSIWHSDTKGCLFDDVPQPSDIAIGLRLCQICAECKKKIQDKISRDAVLRHVFSYVDNVLDWLRPQHVTEAPPPDIESPVRGRSSRSSKLMEIRHQRETTPLSSAKYLYALDGGYLRVDRNLIINEIKRRYNIDVEPDFADSPQKIEQVIESITAIILGPRRRWQPLKQLLKCNRFTDGLNTDIKEKRHRDHTLHQLYVAMLGFILLDASVVTLVDGKRFGTEFKTLRSIIANKLKLDENLTNAVWFLTAALHDHAYPVADVLHRVKRDLRVKATHGGWQYVADRLAGDVGNLKKSRLVADDLLLTIPKYVQQNSKWPAIPDADGFEKQYTDLLIKSLSKLVDQSELRRDMAVYRYDHGVVGAANLLLKSAHDEELMTPVSRAIFDHNLERAITLEEHPLSFLLKLCDTLQEWDRVVYTSDGERVRESEAIYLGPFEQIDDGLLVVEKALLPKFDFGKEDLLKKTGWKEGLWVEGTTKHLGLLQNCGSVFVKVSDIEIKYARSIA